MSKYAWSPGRIEPIREHVRVRAAALARDRVDRLHELRPHLEEPGVREPHDVALADARLQRLEDVLVDAVDHRAGLRQQHDLVRALDLACVGHHLLAVAHRDPRGDELEEHRRLRHVDAERHVRDAVLGHDRPDLLRGARLQPDARVDRALQPGVPPDRVRGVVQVRELQAVRLGRGAEVEDPGPPGAREEGVPLPLVEGPVPDLRAGDVADVAGLEQQQRAEVGRLERLPGPVEPVRPQPLEVDTDLPVDAGDARRRRGRDREPVRHIPSSPRAVGGGDQPHCAVSSPVHDTRLRATRARGRSVQSGCSVPTEEMFSRASPGEVPGTTMAPDAWVGGHRWRRRRDLNTRGTYQAPNRFRGGPVRPLRHASVVESSERRRAPDGSGVCSGPWMRRT